jgi:hypothetical protein
VIPDAPPEDQLWSIKLLELMLYDLGACVGPPLVPR